MILVLASDGSTRLEAPVVFDRFHCEIDPAHADLEAARTAWAGVVELASRETAWVGLQRLLNLAPGDGPALQAWQRRISDMATQAARHGCFRDAPPAIKSHVVLRA